MAFQMDFFVWNPERITVVAGAFLLMACLALKRFNHFFRSWPLFAAAILWGLYALYEWIALEKGWDIRVDLLIIYPVLFGASIAAFILALRGRGIQAKKDSRK